MVEVFASGEESGYKFEVLRGGNCFYGVRISPPFNPSSAFLDSEEVDPGVPLEMYVSTAHVTILKVWYPLGTHTPVEDQDTALVSAVRELLKTLGQCNTFGSSIAL